MQRITFSDHNQINNQSLLRIGVIFLLAISSCNKIVEFSPYESSRINCQQNITHNNLQKLVLSDTLQGQPFTFAIIADNHAWYNELRQSINAINKRNDIHFILHAGDLTEGGVLKEYEFVTDILQHLRQPFFTAIGNHDCLAQGQTIYQNIYGPLNYSFRYHQSTFIVIHDNLWEEEGKVDFDWLEKELILAQNAGHIFVLAHVPPYGDQFSPYYEERYHNLMAKYHVTLSIHGHGHNFEYREYYDDSINYLMAPCSGKKKYVTVHVTPDDIQVQLNHS